MSITTLSRWLPSWTGRRSWRNESRTTGTGETLGLVLTYSRNFRNVNNILNTPLSHYQANRTPKTRNSFTSSSNKQEVKKPKGHTCQFLHKTTPKFLLPSLWEIPAQRFPADMKCTSKANATNSDF